VESVARELHDALARTWGDDAVRVEGLRRLSGGATSETWSFDARRADGALVPLVLRRTRAVTVDEAALLRAAAAAGVPVPDVVVEVDGGLIVERIEGETIPRRILREDALAGARTRLAAQCGGILARLHRIAVDAVPGLERPDPLPVWQAMLDGLGQPHPAFELALLWLRERQPPRGRTAVVHGDFRNGNLVVGPDGVRAVLDWELAHLGDPMEDLGWLCVKAWRFGVNDKRVGGFGDEAQLFAAYEDAGGGRVDPEVVRWWEVLGTLKWGIMCIVQAMTHLSGATRSVELAAIGRRVCENEWDVLELIG
jgi:aminoglycoside phosphotransferase (APT) family kinase protein